MSRQTILKLMSLLLLAGIAPCAKPPLAPTPPMGWNSWEAFRKDLQEDAIKAQADAIVQLGLRDAGYVYIVLDGGWKVRERDAAGKLVVDPKKFPHGMKALADYVHARGLKLGLHQPGGVKDCGHDQPGSQGYEASDAATFASWGVDFIKYDQCDYVHEPRMVPGAPSIDKITVRKDNRVVFITEAEASQNRLQGMARIEDCARCSGGKVVAGIGYGNGSIEFKARAPEAGRYSLEVQFEIPYYGQNRDHFKEMTFFVSVNGGEPHRVDVPYKIPDRYTTSTVSAELELKQGPNVILIDNPLSQEEDVRLSYLKMAGELQRTGRDFMFSTSGAPRPWLWAQPGAHLYRTAGDINNSWVSIMNTLDRHVDTLPFAGPGFWPDPDMLEVGAPARETSAVKTPDPLNITEQRSQFSLWAIMNAPLFISADLRHLNDEAKAILLNREAIAVNQDPLAAPCRRIRNSGDVQVFAKRLKDGEAVALLNRGDRATEIRVTAAELGLDKSVWDVRDLWSAQSQRITDGTIGAVVEPHGVKFVRIRR